MEKDLKGSLSYIYPTKKIQDICVGYILDRDVDYERGWHLATAKATKCLVYIMVDKYFEINKKDWEADFKMFNLLEKEDIQKALRLFSEL